MNTQTLHEQESYTMTTYTRTLFTALQAYIAEGNILGITQTLVTLQSERGAGLQLLDTHLGAFTYALLEMPTDNPYLRHILQWIVDFSEHGEPLVVMQRWAASINKATLTNITRLCMVKDILLHYHMARAPLDGADYSPSLMVVLLDHHVSFQCVRCTATHCLNLNTQSIEPINDRLDDSEYVCIYTSPDRAFTATRRYILSLIPPSTPYVKHTIDQVVCHLTPLLRMLVSPHYRFIYDERHGEFFYVDNHKSPTPLIPRQAIGDSQPDVSAPFATLTIPDRLDRSRSPRFDQEYLDTILSNLTG